MTEYKTIRQEERKASMYHLLVCALAVFNDEALDLLELPSSLRLKINNIRAMEDDFVGCGTAVFVQHLSNYDLTEQDRLVASQVLAVGASAVGLKKVVTKSMLDSKDVLTNRTILESIYNWCAEAKAPNFLLNDAIFEQAVSLLQYMEQYNRDVLDNAKRWTKGETGEDETTKTEEGITRLLSWIPGVGE